MQFKKIFLEKLIQIHFYLNIDKISITRAKFFISDNIIDPFTLYLSKITVIY